MFAPRSIPAFKKLINELLTSGLPHIWAGSLRGYPILFNVSSSLRKPLLIVGFASRYSRLKLTNPFSVKGNPAFTAARTFRPTPDTSCSSNLLLEAVTPLKTASFPPSYWPPWRRICIPDVLSRSCILKTPATASAPYCAAAPSRSTSICFNAMLGIMLRSAPCDPVFSELPSKAIEAER